MLVTIWGLFILPIQPERNPPVTLKGWELLAVASPALSFRQRGGRVGASGEPRCEITCVTGDKDEFQKG